MAMIIFNDYIPVKGFKAMCVYPFIFARNDCNVNFTCINHEEIHCEQQKEMLWIFFFVWYIVEYLIRLVLYKFDTKRAYRKICFEREAYSNQKDYLYTKHIRKRYSFIRYIY